MNCWMRLQFIHLLGESRLPQFRAFESASISVIVCWKEAEILISLLGVSLGARLRGRWPPATQRMRQPGVFKDPLRSPAQSLGDASSWQ